MNQAVNNSTISCVENIDLTSLCSTISEEYKLAKDDTPFYVCDLGDVVTKHKLWIQSFPRITPFYAVKCNPDPVILKLMVGMGLSFDCASREEIRTVMDLGASASRIIYANPCKPRSHIEYAKKEGVRYMTLDSVAEVEKIHRVYPESSVVIRMFVETSKARCPLGLKFGASMEAIESILAKCRDCKLDVAGVSFHVGSGCFDASVYGYAITEARKVFQMAATYGFRMNILDIGGGFPGDLNKPENSKLFQEVRNTINESIDKYFPSDLLGDEKLYIIAEPGRYYVSSAFQLCCTVTSVKVDNIAASTGPTPQYNYFLNDGVYGSFNCVIFDHYLPDSYLLPECNTRFGEKYPAILWGPTCDSMDKISETTLPHLSVGDNIIFSDMGAYTMAAGSTFNGFERPTIHYFVSQHASFIVSEATGILIASKTTSSSASEESYVGADSGSDNLEDQIQQIIDDAIMFDMGQTLEYVENA